MIRSYCGLAGAVAAVALLALLGAGWGCGGDGRPSPPPQLPPVVPAIPPEPPRPAIFTGLPWRPDPAFNGQLGFYKAVEGYEIRVPNGFEEAQVPVPLPEGKRVVWVGPTRDDGTRPVLAAVVITPRPEERTDYGISYIIEKARPPAEECSDWRQSPPETGGLGSWAQ